MRASGNLPGLSEARRFRELLVTLTWRDVRVRYRQSLLGVGWAVLLPFSMMLVFTFVFTRAIDARVVAGVNMPYALYAFAGLVPWTFFSSSLSGCVSSLVANRSLVTKVYFPREVFPLSCIAGAMLDFGIAMLVLGGLMAYFHVRGDWSFTPGWPLLFVPVILGVQTLLTMGLGLLLAMANLFYRDVRQVFGVVIQLWMFVSAVVVPVPQDGTLTARLIALNPLTPIMSAYRDCILHGRWPNAEGFVYASALATLFLIGGWVCFRRASHRFAECI